MNYSQQIDQFIQAVIYDHSVATGLKVCEPCRSRCSHAAEAADLKLWDRFKIVNLEFLIWVVSLRAHQTSKAHQSWQIEEITAQLI